MELKLELCWHSYESNSIRRQTHSLCVWIYVFWRSQWGFMASSSRVETQHCCLQVTGQTKGPHPGFGHSRRFSEDRLCVVRQTGGEDDIVEISRFIVCQYYELAILQNGLYRCHFEVHFWVLITKPLKLSVVILTDAIMKVYCSLDFMDSFYFANAVLHFFNVHSKPYWEICRSYRQVDRCVKYRIHLCVDVQYLLPAIHSSFYWSICVCRLWFCMFFHCLTLHFAQRFPSVKDCFWTFANLKQTQWHFWFFSPFLPHVVASSSVMFIFMQSSSSSWVQSC